MHVQRACRRYVCVCVCVACASPCNVNMRKHALHLDRAKSNPLFDSWRLTRELAVTKTVVKLEAHVTVRDHSTDYLNTRAAVLHNHLHQQDQRILLFTERAGVSALHEVLLGEDVELRKLWGRLTDRVSCYLYSGVVAPCGLMKPHLAEQADGQDARLANKAEAPAQSILQPSVVAVQGSSQECWLVSSGQGEILLIKCSKTHGMNLSQHTWQN